MTTAAEDTARRYRQASETKDIALLTTTLAPDAVLRSPLSSRARFHGARQVEEVLSAALSVVSDVRYHTDVGDERTRMLAATGRLDGTELEESVLLRLDEQARIAELTLWVRPLPALTKLMAALGPALARRKGRPALARLLGPLTAPLVLATDLGDRRLVPVVTGR
ncbi:nuclear transport factor 2 family protein [Thermoactinospora rubra]|uniref:nuclear transport factor 2 family protein n=1 Tax=Thermoactinospora rubra TaxID=1088767 RepID=UPI000A0F5DA0|nr:nuclear transport factor 2 family protein [Thermoactinospora rubra]